MEILDYINLLGVLRESSLGIWRNYLTAALAIVAFVGSVRTLEFNGAVLLCALFLAFSFSNQLGLKKNYELRMEIEKSIIVQANISNLKAGSNDIFKRDYENNKMIIQKYSITVARRDRSILYHHAVSFLVPFLIVIYYKLGNRLTSGSSGRKEHAT